MQKSILDETILPKTFQWFVLDAYKTSDPSEPFRRNSDVLLSDGEVSEDILTTGQEILDHSDGSGDSEILRTSSTATSITHEVRK